MDDTAAGRQPACILSPQAAIPVLRTLLVVPATTNVRAIPTEVLLGREDGMPRDCALSLDNLGPVHKALLTERITRLGPGKLGELCRALNVAAGPSSGVPTPWLVIALPRLRSPARPPIRAVQVRDDDAEDARAVAKRGLPVEVADAGMDRFQIRNRGGGASASRADNGAFLSKRGVTRRWRDVSDERGPHRAADR